MKKYNSTIIKQIENLLNIGISLSVEKDHDKVLEMILAEARKITKADAGTLYLKEKDKLIFKLIQNDTLNIKQGSSQGKISLPPLDIKKENVAAYVALTKKVINIADVYDNSKFNFSGPKKYDSITGYRTKSMLLAPMEDHEGKVLGVLQLINAKNEKNEIIAFSQYFNKVIASLASQAAVSITNLRFLDEIENLLKGLVEIMATAIDSRTPYNASHTLRIARMVNRFIEVINLRETGKYAQEYFNKKRQEELLMAAWLHDIGKIAIPLTIMDKTTRLEDKLELVLQRFDYIELKLEKTLKKKKGLIDKEKELQQKLNLIEKARDLVLKANLSETYVNDEIKKSLTKIACQTYINRSGQCLNWLKAEELEALSVTKGTLTKKEREKICAHVKIASRILQAIPFPERFQQVNTWVTMHHEYLDGTGYPQGLNGLEIPLEARILTIVDIFDALIAADRPYKKSKPLNIALDILVSMVNEGKLDQELVTIFKQEKVWQAIETDDSDSYKIW